MIPPEEHPSRAGRRGCPRDISGGTMPKTLLLADDSVTIQKVVGISFANEDVRLVMVDNGDAAIARARQERPDLILADVVMPGKSGYEVCEAIKADPALRHIPVLLLTGTFEAFDNERASRAGAAPRRSTSGGGWRPSIATIGELAKSGCDARSPTTPMPSVTAKVPSAALIAHAYA